ncbi:MAG: YlmC/YmxH family sporulation protein [Ruminococcaceae bacterium]|nr:YlmC/YmxH family sporulation protein [Oscillospiraceae bacterium]
MSRLSSFQKKEIVNIVDGRRLGFLSDAEVDLNSGKMDAIVVSVPMKNLPLGSNCRELVIPMDRIKKIGEDIILVNVEERYLNVFLRGQTL